MSARSTTECTAARQKEKGRKPAPLRRNVQGALSVACSSAEGDPQEPGEREIDDDHDEHGHGRHSSSRGLTLSATACAEIVAPNVLLTITTSTAAVVARVRARLGRELAATPS